MWAGPRGPALSNLLGGQIVQHVVEYRSFLGRLGVRLGRLRLLRRSDRLASFCGGLPFPSLDHLGVESSSRLCDARQRIDESAQGVRRVQTDPQVAKTTSRPIAQHRRDLEAEAFLASRLAGMRLDADSKVSDSLKCAPFLGCASEVLK